MLPELQEVRDFLAAGQYLEMSQINPKSKETHPDTYPKGPVDSHGGWGHNPGFEDYPWRAELEVGPKGAKVELVRTDRRAIEKKNS